MREQINDNPAVQIGLVAVLLIAAAFMLLKPLGGGGGEEESATTETAATVETPEGTASVTVTTPTETAAPTAAAPPQLPKLRLPKEVRAAIDANRTVVLLVVKRGGIDDTRVEEAVEDLASRSRVATFVVPADQVSRYTAITQPLNLDRTPALIVVRPRKLSRGLPTASVNYGFQSIETVGQAVVDAEYRGPELQYHP